MKVSFQFCWKKLASLLPLEKFCYGWLHRRLLRRYRPQSAVNCSTLWERAAGSSPNTSQVSLCISGKSCQMTRCARMSPVSIAPVRTAVHTHTLRSIWLRVIWNDPHIQHRKTSQITRIELISVVLPFLGLVSHIVLEAPRWSFLLGSFCSVPPSEAAMAWRASESSDTLRAS